MDNSFIEKQTTELKKHINAIHCTNNLTLIQRKLFNALLFNAYADLPNQSQFEVPVRTLCNLIGYNSNDYAKLKKALLALITVAIEWNVIDYSSSDTNKWRASSALASAKLENGTCTYEYSLVMRELLYRPEIYARINMDILSKFGSSYSLALYENCVRFQGIAQTPWFSIQIFRKLMGVSEDKYLQFKDFKRRVLNIAIKEVEQHSPLTIIPEIKRQSQKVVAIRFKLSIKSSSNTLCYDLDKDLANADNEVVNILINEFSLSPETVKGLLSKYEVAYIKEKVDIIVNSENFRTGKIRGVAGYLIDALKKDYKPIKSSHDLNKEKQQLKNNLIADEEEKQKNLKDSYNKYINSIIAVFLDDLSEEKFGKLLNDFEEDLRQSGGLFYKRFKNDGLDNPGIKAIFYSFIKEQTAFLREKIIDFDAFKEESELANSAKI